MRPLVPRLQAIAASDATVLVTGETGSGKGVVAAALHEWSRRRDRRFLKCDCAALAPSLVESELFGHERGAFTGADTRRIGMLEAAAGGTFFLDEIAELTPPLQAKLLGVLEDRHVCRLGSSAAVPLDVRVVAATNHDLDADVRAGRFRPDLFHRLNVLAVRVPPLRDRPDDVPVLARHFANRWRRRWGAAGDPLTDDVLANLARRRWPGNVRELGNAVERVLVFGPDADVEPAPRPSAEPPSVDMPLAEVERRHITAVLDTTEWRVGGPRGAARILRMHPNTLRSRMAKLGIWRPG
jgi:transcriptional regulator with GAF, ATPase, and Fis domain